MSERETEAAAWVAEMARRRKLALTYFHPKLHAPEAAKLRRSRDVVWDRRFGVYLFPDRDMLDRCRAACEALDRATAAEETARLEAAGYDVDTGAKRTATPPPRQYTLRLRRSFPVGAVVRVTPERQAEGYPPFLRVLRVTPVLLPSSILADTSDLQQVFVILCEAALPPEPPRDL